MAPFGENKVESPAQKALRKAYEQIKPNGRYQKTLIFLMAFVWVTITYSTMINSYIFMNPVFHCGGRELPESEACRLPGYCMINNNLTGSYEAGLYCENKISRSFIQSSYPIGCLIGVLFCSMLSDIKGRRYGLLVCLFFSILGSLTLTFGIYIRHYYCMVLGQIFCGMFAGPASNITYVITGDVVSSSMRQRSIMIYCAVWGVTQLTFWPIEIYLPLWKQYMLFMAFAPAFLIYLLCHFFVLEAPSFYLINQRDEQKCLQMIDAIAKINKVQPEKIAKAKNIMKEAFNQSHVCSNAESSSGIGSILRTIFSDPWFRTALICMSCIQTGFNTFYYGVLSSLERTGSSFGISVFLVGLHQFLGYASASYFIINLRRKRGLFIVNLTTSLLGLSFILQYIKQSPAIQSTIISLSTLGFVYSYSLSQMINTEAYSPEVQSTAIGMSTTMSMLGRFFTPFILNAMNDVGIHPIIAVSLIFFILGVPPIFFLRETLKLKKNGELFSEASESEGSTRSMKGE